MEIVEAAILLKTSNSCLCFVLGWSETASLALPLLSALTQPSTWLGIPTSI